MIGKVQDVMSAAIVIGAAESAGSSTTPRQQSADSTAMESPAPKAANEAQNRTANQPDKNQATGAQAQKEEAPKEKPEEKLSEESVSLITQELNELMSKINCNLQFNYNTDVDVMSVKMVDKSTNEVIKELPPEEMIKNIRQAREWIGAFLDKNA